MEEYMIEHIAARPGGGDGDFEILLDPLLADVFVKAARPQAQLEARLFLSTDTNPIESGSSSRQGAKSLSWKR